jgi:tetratricopeptide (TPR) repeat protein
MGPVTAAELSEAYGRADYAAVQSAFTRTSDESALIRRFREAGNPWPTAPRREATLALELAEAGLFARAPAARTDARALLDQFARLVRHPLEPDPFERLWHWTAIAIGLGTIRPDLAEPMVERAIARFPSEPRFVLARAVVLDQRLVQGLTGDAAATLQAVLSGYEAASVFPETGDEARIRMAWTLHRAGRSADALARLDEVADGRSPDLGLRYLRQLFRGQALDALGRLDEARAAYETALALVPDTQSARVALMNAHLRRGDRRAAQALAESIQTAPASPDPFASYWQADFRFYPALIARLRDMAR